MMLTVRFVLNGKPRVAVGVEPTRTLLQHLRLHERAPGTKEGCAEGDCGACTVALGEPNAEGGFDFRAVNSCILLTPEVEGRAVVTAEGLADADDAPHPAQKALVELHGSQCGYCTPGFVMSLFAHERAGLASDTDTIHETLSGNLCRCTGYRPIVDAARAMSETPATGFAAREHEWRETLSGVTSSPAAPDEEARYAAPTSLKELDELLRKNPASRLIAGGTDLGVAVAKRAEDPGPLISLSRIAALSRIEETDEGVEIGAGVTYSDALPVIGRRFPAFAAVIRRIGSRQVRNLGTIGGNICNASPIGDSAPCLLALDAEVTIRSVEGRRKLALDDFFTGYRKTALKPGEYLESISIPALRPGQVFRAYKLSKRYDQDISAVSAAFRLTIRDGIVTQARAAFGGMAATPARAPSVEAKLVGSRLEDTKAADAVALDFRPLTDFRGTAAYRLKTASGLVTRLQFDLAGQVPTEVWAL